MNKKSNSLKEDAMHNDPNHWQGPFYINKKDRRILVPKSNPKMGVTINFGNPWSYVLLAGIFVILVLLLA